MKLAVVYEGGEVQEFVPFVATLRRFFTVPAVGKFVRLKHDYQTEEINWYKPRKAATQTEVPETIHLNPFELNDFVPLTQERQEFTLQTMLIANPTMSRGEAINRLHELTRTSVCFTDDGNSWDKGRADYLFGTNVNAAPMGWKMLGFGGNVYRQISSNVIEAIDYNLPLPDPEKLYREKPWLFQWATQCYMQQTGTFEMLGGKMRSQWKVSRFPHMAPVGLLTPVWGAGGRNRIMESWRYAPIANGATYSPYVP